MSHGFELKPATAGIDPDTPALLQPVARLLHLINHAMVVLGMLALLFVGGAIILKDKLLVWVLPLFFTAYLIYGFVRPHISRRMRHEIEEDDEEEEEEKDELKSLFDMAKVSAERAEEHTRSDDERSILEEDAARYSGAWFRSPDCWRCNSDSACQPSGHGSGSFGYCWHRTGCQPVGWGLWRLCQNGGQLSAVSHFTSSAVPML